MSLVFSVCASPKNRFVHPFPSPNSPTATRFRIPPATTRASRGWWVLDCPIISERGGCLFLPFPRGCPGFTLMGYAFNSRPPHILWSATAAACARGKLSGGGRGADGRGSLRLVAGRTRLNLKPEGDALSNPPSVGEGPTEPGSRILYLGALGVKCIPQLL